VRVRAFIPSKPLQFPKPKAKAKSPKTYLKRSDLQCTQYRKGKSNINQTSNLKLIYLALLSWHPGLVIGYRTKQGSSVVEQWSPKPRAVGSIPILAGCTSF
jgi:hypothetical protein